MSCFSASLYQDIVDWFNSIRAVQLHYLKVAFPGASEHEVSKKQDLDAVASPLINVIHLDSCY